MTVFFTSDTHFLHTKLSALRGFDSIHAHDATLIAKWNAIVRTDDIVWLLGDVGIPGKGFTDTDVLDLVDQLHGHKQLVTGNHDSPWPAHRNARKHQKLWLRSFESVQPFARASVCGTEFLMSHFPYEGDHGEHEDRGTQYRLRDEGMPLLHGHVHSNQQVTDAKRMIFHVGMDAWDMYPVKDTRIKELWGG